MKEVLDIKYKDLEESKPILEVLENYVMYKKKLDEILIGNERLNKKDQRAESTIEALAGRQTSCVGRLGGSVSVLFKFESACARDTLPNPLIAEYKRRNKRNTITYLLQHVSNANLKWRDLQSVERHAYGEKLSKLQERSFGVPRIANWRLFDGYSFEDTLRV
ncbi:hypothetical protein Tco_0918568 [Tanacetum coccineum]